MKIFDKRLEMLEAAVVSVKFENRINENDELEFVEFPDIPYVKELIEKLKLEGLWN